MGIGSDLWKQYETLTNNRDWAGATSLFTTDAVYDSPGGRHEGSEAIAAFYQRLANAGEANPGAFDTTMETSLVIEDGNTVAAEFTVRAGATDVGSVAVSTVKDGKFATMHVYYDSVALSKLFA